MTRFLDADLSLLPPLPLAAPTFDAIREARAGELAARLVEEGFGFDVGALETDPMVMAVARAGGVRELLAITRGNDGVRAVMLATSYGPFLDHLGATQTPRVYRKAIVANPRPYVWLTASVDDWEADDDLRRRIQLAPEQLSTAGPEGSYLGYALATPGVKTVAVWAPMSFGGTILKPFTGITEVRVPVVAQAGNGTASPALCAAVEAELRPDDRRPVADFVTAMPATILPYRIRAVLEVGSGVDGGLLIETARNNLKKLAARQHRPGASQLLDRLKGAAYVVGTDGTPLVERVRLLSPAADINAVPITVDTPDAAYAAPYCENIDAIEVTFEVVDD